MYISTDRLLSPRICILKMGNIWFQTFVCRGQEVGPYILDGQLYSTLAVRRILLLDKVLVTLFDLVLISSARNR